MQALWQFCRNEEDLFGGNGEEGSHVTWSGGSAGGGEAGNLGGDEDGSCSCQN